MNYQQLQAKIIATSHRKDMVANAPQFIEDARELINERLHLELVPLVNPDDTNAVLTDSWLLYFYASMKALYEFIVEFEGATYYDGLFSRLCDEYYISRPGTEPLVITPEEPAP